MTEHTDPWTRLAKLWPLFAHTRFPGTRRPWRTPELSPAQAAERDAAARIERLMAEVFLGAPQAPLHLDVIDTLDQLHRQLRTAARLLDTPGLDHIPAMRTSLHDPRPLLEWCRHAARNQPDGIPADAAAWDMLHVIERALAEIWAGQKLTAECPWCHGGLTVSRQTWHVRILPGNMPAIVCESGTCEPPEQEAGTWWRGMPAWPLWEWDWLAQRLEHDGTRHAGSVS